MPCRPHGNDQRADFGADSFHRASDLVLPFRRSLTRPCEIEDGFRAVPCDLRMEQPNAFVIALGALEGQRALLLQDDVVPWRSSQSRLCLASIPVPLEARTA